VNIIQLLKKLGPAKLAALASVGVFMLAFLVFFAARMSASRMEILYTGLDHEQAARVIAELDAQNIRYEVRAGGTEIIAPANQINRLKVQMAGVALGEMAAGGYEIFDRGDSFGTTNFMQQVNLVRALEGELARSIRSINGVQSARVHLVMPRREMFSREQQAPSASVVVRMQDGRLDGRQALAIQRLVASAVPGMDINSVSIMDTRGVLLTRPFTSPDAMALSSNEEMRRSHEVRLTQAVQDLLERTVGMGKIRAEVNVDMDFAKVVTNREIFDPDQQVVRSMSTSTETAQSTEQDGVVTVQQNLPDRMANETTGSRSSSERVEETINYEISRETVNQINNSGVIRRLSVAVLVDGNYTVGAHGERVYHPRTTAEMNSLTTLVKTAVGFDAARGDQVSVVNLQFVNLEDSMPAEPRLFLGLQKDEAMRLAEGLGIALVAVFIILLVVRPMIVRAFSNVQEAPVPEELMITHVAPVLTGPGVQTAQLDAPSEDNMELDTLIDIAKVEGRVKASSLRKIGEIVDKHPEEALNIIRAWLHREGGN